MKTNLSLRHQLSFPGKSRMLHFFRNRSVSTATDVVLCHRRYRYLFYSIAALSAVVAWKASSAQQANAKQPRREGTELREEVGKFAATGDRMTFYPTEGGPAMRVLENLALERVAQVASGTHEGRLWKVSGFVTEYQGVNYLFIRRAVLKRSESRL